MPEEDKETQSGPPRRDNRPEERESIWSVPQRLRGWYAGIFAAEYLLFLALTIWDEVVNKTDDTAIQTILAIQRGMSQNLLQIAGSAYVILEAYMLAEWLRERDQRREREAVARAERAEAEARQRAEALQEARREAARELNHQWRAWYWRQQAAFRDGRPFDEPPPGGPFSENGADQP